MTDNRQNIAEKNWFLVLRIYRIGKNKKFDLPGVLNTESLGNYE